MGKLENLKSVAWKNSTPSIMHVSDAYQLPHDTYHFYMVN